MRFARMRGMAVCAVLAVALSPAGVSAAEATDPVGSPENTLAPAIAGSAADGTRLTAATGTWSGATPMTFAFQWRRCAERCTDIEGATRSTYTLASVDVGARIAVSVTATNPTGTATSDSAPTDPVMPVAPVNITRQTLSGTPVDGGLLTTSLGRWTGTQPMAFEYQWRRCDVEGERCTVVEGAVEPSYRMSFLDIGRTIRARVIATNVVGSTMRSSMQTAPVEVLPLVSSTPPTVSGVLIDGRRLSASPGLWQGSGPLALGYSWRRCGTACVDIPGAAGASYVLTSADVGAAIVVAVTASAPGGEMIVESERTGVVAAAEPANITRQLISGTTSDGELLTTTVGRWTGTQPMAFEYQWRRCDTSGQGCETISGATEQAYRVGNADVGSTLRSRVIAMNSAGIAMRSSLPTPVVDAVALAAAERPKLSGTPRDGLKVEVSAGTWTGSQPTAIAYQWRLCRPAVPCAEIARATGPAYRLTSADVGAQVLAVVTATNSRGAATASSEPSAPVDIRRVYATAETVPVNLSGDAADDVAIWPDRVAPARSLVVGTTKAGTGGLSLYEPSGTLVEHWADGKMDNVDLRDGFALGGETVTLVTAGSRSTKGGKYPNGWIALYRLDPASRKLVDVAASVVSPTIPTYGSCMYRSPATGRYYYFVVSTSGDLEQYELKDDGHGRVDAVRVRAFSVGSISEGCVADDERGVLYVAEENRGIWRYAAEPDAGSERSLVDSAGSDGHLVADVEGLALTYGPDGTGYLIASSQGDDTFAVYRREGANPFVRRFDIADRGLIDGVNETDGVDATTASLGPAFPQGAFIAHDGSNAAENQNYKFVPLQDVTGDEAPE